MSSAILFDGLPLVHAPLSPPALHLRDTLAALPEGIDAHIALPEAAPAGLPDTITAHIMDSPNSPAGRLRWEQRSLPGLAGKLGAALHLVTATAPLFTRRPVLVSPAGDGSSAEPANGFIEVLRSSLGRGGTSNSRILWPADLPPPAEVPGAVQIPRSPHPAFKPHNFFLPPSFDGAPELPATCFLVHIRPEKQAITAALEAWTWAAGPIGEVYPLLFLALPDSLQAFTRKLARELHIRAESIQFFPAVPAHDLPRLYQAASAVFLPQAASPWGSPLQYGLACGVPVIAIETAVSSAIAGPAAYLIPKGDPRSMGAALIAVTVKDHLRKQLVDAALERTAAWDGEKARRALAEAYSRTG